MNHRRCRPEAVAGTHQRHGFERLCCMTARQAPQGTVYLLCFGDHPYRHAKHYLGFTTDLDARLAAHAAGRGARLLEVITAAGITFTLARTWQGTRSLERKLKNQHNSCRLCPICQAARRAAPAPPGGHAQRPGVSPRPSQ
jgi:predicted GIY-YIG superfamily endonuclease